MASPPSGADNSTKVAKDRNCPFCGQSFTSSSLGRHLDLYIKPKNPKPADGIHDVDEIRKLRGNITRRQSRVTSIKKDASTPSGPASARYTLEESATTSTGSPDPMATTRPSGVFINRAGWETTGVINNLPPRVDSRSSGRRDSSKKDQLKADLDQRQKLVEELDSGRAAQLALKELISTIRTAEASATGKDMYDFDFFQSSFATLCLRILSPPLPLTSSLPINTSDSWSLDIPWEEQREALLRDVETRGKLMQQHLDIHDAEEPPVQLDLQRFYRHISHTFELWKSLAESYRKDIWEREILRGYVRLDGDLKDARNTINSLRREVEHLSKRLDKMHNNSSLYPHSFQERYNSPYAPLTSLRLSDDLLRDICKQGLNLRAWDYDRLMDKWKSIVKDERSTINGMGAQRALSTSSQHTKVAGAAIGPESTASRSASIISVMSAAPPTRTSSMDSGSQEVDAEGEDDELPDGVYRPHAVRKPDRRPTPANNSQSHSGEMPTQERVAPHQMSLSDPRLSNVAQQTPLVSPLNTSYKWPQSQTSTPTAFVSPTSNHADPTKNLPPGPDSWRAEFNRAAAAPMEGLEGPVTGTSAPLS